MVLPRALMAWEAGAGRGHVITLGTMARALAGRFVSDAALRSLDHAREIAADCALVFRGPALTYAPAVARGPQGIPTASWGDYLADIGFADPELVRARVDWWQRLMRERDYRLLVADYAPAAMLAARSLGIPAIAVGTAFGLPPAGLDHFPDLFPSEARQRVHDEAALAARLNRVLASLGVPALGTLPEIYRCALQIVRTPPAFDPYARWRREPAIALHPLPAPRPGPRGDGVFLYLSTGPDDGGGLVEAALALGRPVLAYAPALSAAACAKLAASGAEIAPAPLPLADIARRCTLAIHHGQPGMALAALAAGLHQAVLPLHAEHRFHANALEQMGCGIRLSETGPGSAPGAALAQFAQDSRARAVASPDAATVRFLRQDHAALLADRLRGIGAV